MYVYQVKVTVADEHAQKYEDYMLKGHVRDLIETGCFTHAHWAEEKFAAVPGHKVFIAQYFAPSADHIKTYLRDHAPGLRAHAINNLGNIFKAERMVSIQTKVFD